MIHNTKKSRFKISRSRCQWTLGQLKWACFCFVHFWVTNNLFILQDTNLWQFLPWKLNWKGVPHIRIHTSLSVEISRGSFYFPIDTYLRRNMCVQCSFLSPVIFSLRTTLMNYRPPLDKFTLVYFECTHFWYFQFILLYHNLLFSFWPLECATCFTWTTIAFAGTYFCKYLPTKYVTIP